jgi:curved DNA-binding protein CbpA
MIKYYQILGLESNATQDQIKEAYRKLIFKFHPDRNLGDLEAEKKFKEIQEAYEILTNQSSKSKYFDDTFNIKINKNNPFIKGKDINLNIDITLEEYKLQRKQRPKNHNKITTIKKTLKTKNF